MSATTITSPPAMLSFPNLFVAKGVLGGPPKFSATFIFGKEAQATPEWAAMKAAVTAAITARLGADKAADKAFRRTLRNPFRDAGEKQQQGYEPGMIFINCSTSSADVRPKVVDRTGREIIDGSEVWAGQIVRASLSCFYYDKAGNRGVSFGLNHVQVLKSAMPRIDGRITPDQAFSTPLPGGDLIGAGADDEVI